MYECENVINIGGKKWKFTLKHGHEQEDEEEEGRGKKYPQISITSPLFYSLLCIFICIASIRLCVKLSLITIIISFFFWSKKEASKEEGKQRGLRQSKRKKYWMEWNEKSCILINIFSFFMIMLIWIFMLVIKGRIYSNKQENPFTLRN